ASVNINDCARALNGTNVTAIAAQSTAPRINPQLSDTRRLGRRRLARLIAVRTRRREVRGDWSMRPRAGRAPRCARTPASSAKVAAAEGRAALERRAERMKERPLALGRRRARRSRAPLHPDDRTPDRND